MHIRSVFSCALLAVVWMAAPGRPAGGVWACDPETRKALAAAPAATGGPVFTTGDQGLQVVGWSVPVVTGPGVNVTDRRMADCAPSISSDGLTLYFESERPGGRGSVDIWYSVWDGSRWADAVNLGPPVNTAGGETKPSISAGGNDLYFVRAGDIWVSRKAAGQWGTPVKLASPVNTPAQENSPSVTADGLKLYFTSDRTGGLGDLDVWVSTRPTTGSLWGVPANLGSAVNSPLLDWYVAVAPDDSALYVISSRPGGYGDIDLWVSRRLTGGAWGAAANAGPPLNWSGPICHPTVSADGQTLFFGGTFEGGFGDLDVWTSTRSSTAAGSANPAAPAPAPASADDEKKPEATQAKPPDGSNR